MRSEKDGGWGRLMARRDVASAVTQLVIRSSAVTSRDCPSLAVSRRRPHDPHSGCGLWVQPRRFEWHRSRAIAESTAETYYDKCLLSVLAAIAHVW